MEKVNCLLLLCVDRVDKLANDFIHQMEIMISEQPMLSDDYSWVFVLRNSFNFFKCCV